MISVVQKGNIRLRSVNLFKFLSKGILLHFVSVVFNSFWHSAAFLDIMNAALIYNWLISSTLIFFLNIFCILLENHDYLVNCANS